VGEGRFNHESQVGEEPVVPRDRYMDFVRVVCMATVVYLHWLSVVPTVEHGLVTDRNVVELVPSLWPLTWIGDVMALFFFVGGYANAVSMRTSAERGESTTAYLLRRFNRLLRPTFWFLGFWLALDLAFRLFNAGAESPLRHVSIGNTIPFGPLWFIGVYLVVIALSPWTHALHKRWGAWVVVAMLFAVAALDAFAFGFDNRWPLAGNLLLVWLIPHQVGYFYADGVLQRLSTWACVGLAVIGLVGLAALTSLPYYSRSLISPRWQVLTIDAPSLSLVAAGLWLIGAALALRRVTDHWLESESRWRWVSRANDVTMPVFLWHMTAYLIAVALLWWVGAGYAYGTAITTVWWFGRIPVILLSTLVLAGIFWTLRAITRFSRHARQDTQSRLGTQS
jgi:hypothetical protein